MMRIPPVDLGFLCDRGRELCGRVTEAWEDRGRDASGPNGPEAVAAGIGHLCGLLEGLEAPARAPRDRPGSTELRDLGAYGVGLLARLADCARRAGMDEDAAAAETLAVPFSLLLVRQGAELSPTVLEPVVNALAALANGLSDPGDMAQLFGLMGEVVGAVSPAAAQDPGWAGTRQPWRVLLLNRAIVATRSHRPALMQVAFDAVVEHLPHDAARFFEEGMAQMDALDYPPHVRAVMERYYLQQGPAPHTLH